MMDELSKMRRTVAPDCRSRSCRHQRGQCALLREVRGARLCNQDLELGNHLEPREHDVLRLGMCRQAEANTVERGPELDDRRRRIQELSELLLKITVISTQKGQEVRRHVSTAIQSRCPHGEAL